jgi:TDG/mug DNA glycosylase family protein
VADLDLSQLAPTDIPLALADAHWRLEPGDMVRLRFGSGLDPALEQDLVEGAGFEARQRDHERLLSLPDTVGAGMGLLVCGLNPSIYAAETGVGFGRPGNRFWPAALDAGLVGAARDPRGALADDGIGMTDLVKRATRRADELLTEEYRHGVERVERLVAWLAPGAVCFVGLAGWRAAVDKKAVAGPQDRRLGDRPVYVMPSTSGLNAHATRADLAAHLSAASLLSE